MAALVAFILASARVEAVTDLGHRPSIQARFADCARQVGRRAATEIIGDFAEAVLRCFGPQTSDMVLNELETRLSQALRSEQA